MIAALLLAVCNTTLWQHVYHPSRLTIVNDCTTLEGVVEHRRHEPDADWHIQLKLDTPLDLTTDAMKTAWKRNVAKQHSDLVLEPICFGTVKQSDAKKPCQHTPSIDGKVPVRGDHVRITGPLVIDTEANHGWIEIHAPSKIEVLP